MNARACAEAAFWDAAYGQTGAHHHGIRWTRAVEEASHLHRRFLDRLSSTRDARVLSLGGGVDRIGVWLAERGNMVTTVDVSVGAAAVTSRLARDAGVSERIRTLVSAAEEVVLPEASFDLVVFKRSLHHMDVAHAIERAHALLAPGGRLIAEEPLCLAPPLRWLHERLSFHPDGLVTSAERELSALDIEIIRRTFRVAVFRYFDLLARESVGYVLWRTRLLRALRSIGRFDDLLVNSLLPSLRYLTSYVIVEAEK